MIDDIYFWVLFVTFTIIALLPTFLFLSTFFGDDIDDAEVASYLIPLSALLLGIVPIMGNLVLPLSALTRGYWIVQAVILGFLFLIFIFHARRFPHYFFSLLLTLGIDLTMWLSHSEMLVKHDLPYFGNLSFTLPESIYSIWIPLSIVSFIFALLLRRKEINYVEIPKKYTENVTKSENSFADAVIRKSIENLSEKFSLQTDFIVENMERMVHELNSIRVSEFSNSGKKVSLKLYEPMIELLQAINVKVDTMMESQENRQMPSASSVSNLMLIKEITHFIATPLANIETNCTLLESLLESSKKDQQIRLYIERISSAVALCKGILATYREIYLCSKSDESCTLKEFIQDSFEIYKEREKKELQLYTNIKESYAPSSNYFLISLVMPLLSNAVAASKNNTTIELLEANGVLKISNTYYGDIDITLFDIEGYSSKKNHKGLGLYTVRHLLASRKLGKLKCYKENNRIYFELPILKNE